MSSVVVIGSGLAGLSAACYLTGQGHEVTVVEREPIPGGRAGRLNRDGFAFDTGPTVLTMPDLIAEPLRAVGSELSDLLPLKRLDPAYRARFADGSTIDIRSGHEAMREEIARTCGSFDAASFDEFVSWLRKLYLVELPTSSTPTTTPRSGWSVHQLPWRNSFGWERSGDWATRFGNGSAILACTDCSVSRPCTPALLRTLHWPSTR